MYPGRMGQQETHSVQDQLENSFYEEDESWCGCFHSILQSVSLLLPEAVDTGHLILAFALNLFVLFSADHDLRMMEPT